MALSARYTLLALNVVAIFFSVGLCGVAIFCLSESKELNLPEVFNKLVIIFLIGAIFGFIVAIVGCCGASSPNNCKMFLYGVLALLIFGGMISSAVVIFTSPKYIEATASQIAEDIFTVEHEEDASDVDWVQRHFRCCGVNGPESWVQGGLPRSCCDDPRMEYPEGRCPEHLTYKSGCRNAVSSFAKKWAFNFAIFLSVNSALKLLCTTFAFILASSDKIHEATHTGYLPALSGMSQSSI